MAVTLIGEVVNEADAVTGFNVGNISGDDDFVEPTGAIGLKAATGVNEMYTTTLGATAPYDFTATGAEAGYHVIMWFNTKTPIDATSGLQIIFGNGTDRGRWYVPPLGFYKGGFVTAVVDAAREFDIIAAGTWTLTGNPGQLSNVTEVGGAFNMTTSLMGNFNNIQLDQFTIGLGVRVDAGTVSVPNTFETVRVQDEDTSFWGWWSSVQGVFLGKGKLFIGPETGTATSVFTDTAFAVIFAQERVAADFYEINVRGSGADVNWKLGSISVADTTVARWSLTIQSDTGSFQDNNSVFLGFKTLSLNANTTLTGTTFVDGQSIVQNGATLNGCTVLNSATADGVALISSNNPANISNCKFNFSDGHALEITSAGTYSFSGNSFTGYGASDTTDAAIYNNSGGAVTLDIAGGGDTPTVRNGTSASTTVNNNISITLTGMKDLTEVRVFEAGSTTVELAGIEDATAGTVDDRSFTFTLSAGVFVDIYFENLTWIADTIENFEVPVADASIPVAQRQDRVYSNP